MSQQTLCQPKSIGYEWINCMCLLGSRAILYFGTQKIIHCLPRTECITFTMPLSLAGQGLKRQKLRAGFFMADTQKMFCQFCHVQHSPCCGVSCDCVSCEQTWDTEPWELVIYFISHCLQLPVTPEKNGSDGTEDMWLESLWKKSILPKFLFIPIIGAL